MELTLHHSDTDYEQLNQHIMVRQECTDSGHKIVSRSVPHTPLWCSV